MNARRFALALILGAILGSVGTLAWFRIGPGTSSAELSAREHFPVPSVIGADGAPSDQGEAASDATPDWEAMASQPITHDARIQEYLERHGRSKDALIAAGQLTQDLDLLREAAERFPEDPHVQFLAISNDLFPEQRREWVERFHASQPDNAVAAYYMAGEHFKALDADQAIEELRRGAALDTFDDFSDASMLGTEGLALDLGLSSLEAKVRGMFGLPLPYLTQFVEITNQLETYHGEQTSPDQANDLAALGVALGNDFSQGPASRLLINQLVGLSIETRFLRQLDPSMESSYFSGTPEALLAEIQRDRNRIKEIASSEFTQQFMELDEPMAMHYLDRVRTQGEAAATEWLRSRNAK